MLTRDDITMEHDSFVVMIRSSKTDQMRKGCAVRIAFGNSDLSPGKITRSYLDNEFFQKNPSVSWLFPTFRGNTVKERNI